MLSVIATTISTTQTPSDTSSLYLFLLVEFLTLFGVMLLFRIKWIENHIHMFHRYMVAYLTLAKISNWDIDPDPDLYEVQFQKAFFNFWNRNPEIVLKSPRIVKIIKDNVPEELFKRIANIPGKGMEPEKVEREVTIYYEEVATKQTIQ